MQPPLANQNAAGLPVIIGKRTVFIRPQEIIYIRAEDNYCHIKLSNLTNHMVCHKLGEYERLLEDCGFFRCHKSFLVNMTYIQEIIKGKKAFLLMINREKLPVSRRKLASLNRLLRLNSNNTVYPLNYTVYPVGITVN